MPDIYSNRHGCNYHVPRHKSRLRRAIRWTYDPLPIWILLVCLAISLAPFAWWAWDWAHGHA